MNHYDLSDEEHRELKELETGLETGELESAPDLAARKQELQALAKNTLNKTRPSISS
jgi:hypothetical protein